MDYEVGDSLGIYPHNDADKVSEFCEWYGLNEHAVLRLEDSLPDRNEPLPSNLTVQQLFGQVLDVFGRPKRRFYELLSLVATDAAEQAVLEALSKGGLVSLSLSLSVTLDGVWMGIRRRIRCQHRGDGDSRGFAAAVPFGASVGGAPDGLHSADQTATVLDCVVAVGERGLDRAVHRGGRLDDAERSV